MSRIDWTKFPWEDWCPRLTLIAAGKINRLSWRGKRGGVPPAATSAQDIVNGAIEKTISGQRSWSQERSLFDHLVGVISSDINHLATSHDNTTNEMAEDKVVNIEDHRASPESVLIRKQQEDVFLNFLEREKPILRQLAYLILHDAGAIADLPVKMNLSIEQMETLKKALRRAVVKFMLLQNGVENTA